MRISDDINRVMDSLRKSVDANGSIDLGLMLKEVVLLFERVKILLPQTNEEERKEIFISMAQMHTFLLGEIKRLAEKTGLSESQLLMFSENPDNFSKEQWSLLTEVKTRMGKQAEEIRDVMKTFATASLPHIGSSSKKKEGSKIRAKKGKKGQLRA